MICINDVNGAVKSGAIDITRFPSISDNAVLNAPIAVEPLLAETPIPLLTNQLFPILNISSAYLPTSMKRRLPSDHSETDSVRSLPA